MRRYEIVEEINQMEYWFFAFICPFHIVQIILRQMKFILISTAWVLSEREQTQGKITSIPYSSSWVIQLYACSKKYELSRTCWTLPSHSLISSNSIALALVYDRLMESQIERIEGFNGEACIVKIKVYTEHKVMFAPTVLSYN